MSYIYIIPGASCRSVCTLIHEICRKTWAHLNLTWLWPARTPFRTLCCDCLVQVTVAACTFVMQAGEASFWQGSPTKYLIYFFLNDLLQASNTPKDEHSGSFIKTFWWYSKNLVHQNMKTLMIPQLHRRKKPMGSCEFFYSILQCCKSRAGQDLFVTDNEGNLVHQENKLRFALADWFKAEVMK